MMFMFSDDRYDKERDSARTMDTRESYEHNNNTGCNYASRGDWAATEEALTSAEKDTRDFWEMRRR